jgi:glycosyltransferase involved in cell wall biosynthesis
MKKTRLAFVAWCPRVSGIEVALCALLENLDYDRFDVSVLFTSNVNYEGSSILPRLDPRARVFIADRAQRVSFERRYLFNWMNRLGGFLWRSLPRALRPVGRLLFDSEAKLYSRYIRRNLGPAADVDTVVLYHPFASEEAVRVFTRRKFLLVYHCGAREQIYHQEMGFAAADRILSVGCRVANDIRAWYPDCRDKVVVSENLVDVRNVLKMAKAPPTIAFEPGVLHVVTCARLDKLKGIDLALDAMAKLVASGVTNFHYHVIGWDLDAPTYEAQLRRLRLEPYVTLHGHDPNPYPMMKRADVYLQPSRMEALGLTIAEALLLGSPVVATRAQGCVEQLSAPGVKGVLCDISSDAIAAALKPLLADADARDALRNGDYLAHCEAANRERLARFTSLADVARDGEAASPR